MDFLGSKRIQVGYDYDWMQGKPTVRIKPQLPKEYPVNGPSAQSGIVPMTNARGCNSQVFFVEFGDGFPRV